MVLVAIACRSRQNYSRSSQSFYIFLFQLNSVLFPQVYEPAYVHFNMLCASYQRLCIAVGMWLC